MPCEFCPRDPRKEATFDVVNARDTDTRRCCGVHLHAAVLWATKQGGYAKVYDRNGR